jgi:nanoRNase/pAp phosphatase (c-di-AMP/oligoRNAs hydrolase)
MPQRLRALLKVARSAGHLLVLTHNDPDPDAIASALALQYLLDQTLGLKTELVYKGIIGRAENQALVRYLGKPLRHVTSADLSPGQPIALVDSQPGAGNNALRSELGPLIVIDHHPWRQATATAAFFDVRANIGSTSTMITEYLRLADITPPPRVATGLFYGIKTDTLGLLRGASPTDVEAYFHLQSSIDVEALVEIERAQVAAEYFQRLDAALHAARVYQDVIISYVGPMRRPDLAAEMADLLLRLRHMQWAVCMGAYQGTLILAVRTRSRRLGAGRLVQHVVDSRGTAGGHGIMAGGQVPLFDQQPQQVADALTHRVLEFLEIPLDTAGVPLMAQKDEED